MANYSWKTTTVGDWSNPALWQTNGAAAVTAPGVSDTATVSLASGTISATGFSFGTVNFNDSAATLTWLPDSGASLATLNGVFTLTAGNIGLGADTSNFASAGLYNINGSGTLVDNGVVVLDQSALGAGASGQTIAVAPALLIGGHFTAANATAVTLQGSVTVNAGGTLDIEGDGFSTPISTLYTVSNLGSLVVGNVATVDIVTSLNASGGILVTGLNSTLQFNTGMALTDTGTITLAQGATLSATTLIAPTAVVAFADNQANQVTVSTSNIYPAINIKVAGFTAGDLFDFTNLVYGTATSLTVSGTTATLSNGANTIGTLSFDSLAGISLHAASDMSYALLGGTASGIQITATASAACFAPGTRIETPDGAVPIERITPGALVITASGQARQVIWTGRRHLVIDSTAMPENLLPVRIRAHAFGPDLPRRDLVVSPDHALHFAAAGQPNGVLIPARHLIDGIAIVQEPATEVTWHHLELATHDVILAEGLPCESYLDTGNCWSADRDE